MFVRKERMLIIVPEEWGTKVIIKPRHNRMNRVWLINWLSLLNVKRQIFPAFRTWHSSYTLPTMVHDPSFRIIIWPLPIKIRKHTLVFSILWILLSKWWLIPPTLFIRTNTYDNFCITKIKYIMTRGAFK